MVKESVLLQLLGFAMSANGFNNTCSRLKFRLMIFEGKGSESTFSAISLLKFRSIISSFYTVIRYRRREGGRISVLDTAGVGVGNQ